MDCVSGVRSDTAMSGIGVSIADVVLDVRASRSRVKSDGFIPGDGSVDAVPNW